MSFLARLVDQCLAIFIRFVVSFGAKTSSTPDEVRHIKSRDAGRTIKIHLYRPTDSSSDPSPVLLNFHGSGFMLPFHGTDDEFCRRISSQTQYTVVDVPYRLAPEHPFPAALNDVEDAINYIRSRTKEFDPAQISLSGFSAGGNLALAATSSLFPRDTFRSLLAFYPVTDLSAEPTSKFAPVAGGRAIPLPLARLFNRCYTSGFDKRDPRISPHFAKADQFPRRVLVITADGDSLALEAEDLAQRIKALEGRHVVSERMQGCSHAWDKRTRPGTPQYEAKERAYQLAVNMLNETR